MVLCHQTEKYTVSTDTGIAVDPGPTDSCTSCRSRRSHTLLSRLAAVNFCLFLVGTVQVSRILMYQSQQQGSFIGALKALGQDIKGTTKKTEAEVVTDAKKEVEL